MRPLLHVLAQEADELRLRANAGVELWVGSGDIGSQLDQVPGSLVRGQRLPHLARCFALARIQQLRRQATDRLQDIDGWIVTGRRELPGKNNMTVENGADGIADRFLKVVAL